MYNVQPLHSNTKNIVTQPTKLIANFVSRGNGNPPLLLEAALAKHSFLQGMDGLAAYVLNASNVDISNKVYADVVLRSQRYQLLEKIQRVELKRVLQSLRSAQFEVLVLKGWAIATDLYPESHLRPRADVDLWVNERQFSRVKRKLESFGYKMTEDSGHQVWKQNFTKVDQLNCQHNIDLHCRLSGNSAIDRHFDESELLANSIECSTLPAKRLNNVYSLLHACIHRAFQKDRLIWLHDISLISQILSKREALTFQQLAKSKSLSTLSHDALTTTSTFFEINVECVPDTPKMPELSALLLKQGFWWEPLIDVIASRTVQSAASRVRRTIFPSPKYMLTKYNQNSSIWLPFLYLKRVLNRLATSSKPRE